MPVAVTSGGECTHGPGSPCREALRRADESVARRPALSPNAATPQASPRARSNIDCRLFVSTGFVQTPRDPREVLPRARTAFCVHVYPTGASSDNGTARPWAVDAGGAEKNLRDAGQPQPRSKARDEGSCGRPTPRHTRSGLRCRGDPRNRRGQRCDRVVVDPGRASARATASDAIAHPRRRAGNVASTATRWLECSSHGISDSRRARKRARSLGVRACRRLQLGAARPHSLVGSPAATRVGRRVTARTRPTHARPPRPRPRMGTAAHMGDPHRPEAAVGAAGRVRAPLPRDDRQDADAHARRGARGAANDRRSSPRRKVQWVRDPMAART
jgi:hypothetical protein